MINENDNIYVEILDWVWIEEFHGYGPFKKCLLKVSDIINMLNRNISIKIPDKYLKDIYMIVKQHNLIAEEMIKLKEDAKIADNAEYKLEKWLKLNITRDSRLQAEYNPLEDNDTVAEEKIFNMIQDSNEIDPIIKRQMMKNKNKISLPKLYDMFNEKLPDIPKLSKSPFDDVVLDV
jgi:hypothetical protein